MGPLSFSEVTFVVAEKPQSRAILPTKCRIWVPCIAQRCSVEHAPLLAVGRSLHVPMHFVCVAAGVQRDKLAANICRKVSCTQACRRDQ